MTGCGTRCAPMAVNPGENCGWLVDRFGLSWQVIPTALGRLMGDPDQERAGRVLQAMLGMTKIEIAGLEAAHDGRPAAV